MCVLSGELKPWPRKCRLARILRAAGMTVRVGSYSVRIEECPHFVFQEYGGELGDPQIEADTDTLEELLREAGLISAALTRAGVVHRFEIYDDDNEMCGYLHHEWPLQKSN